jgi:hypothetical protein
MHNGLIALRQVVKRLEYKQKGPERAPLDVIVSTALPLLQQLMATLLESANQTLEAALIMKLCLKVLWSCTQFDLPAGCGSSSGEEEGGTGAAGAAAAAAAVDPAMLAHLGKWLELIGLVIAKPLPEASEGLEPAGQPTTEEERNQWPWWKLKKWALQLLSRWFHRYGMPQYAEGKAFAEVSSSSSST